MAQEENGLESLIHYGLIGKRIPIMFVFLTSAGARYTGSKAQRCYSKVVILWLARYISETHQQFFSDLQKFEWWASRDSFYNVNAPSHKISIGCILLFECV